MQNIELPAKTGIDEATFIDTDVYLFANSVITYGNLFDSELLPNFSSDYLSKLFELQNISLLNKTLIFFDELLYETDASNTCIYAGFKFTNKVKSFKINIPTISIDFNKTVPFSFFGYDGKDLEEVVNCWLKNNENDLSFSYGNLELPSGNLRALLRITSNTLNPTLLDDNVLSERGSSVDFDVIDCHANYTTVMKQYYDATAINIICLKGFNELACSLDYQYLQALYSGNIPLVCGYQAMNILNSIGFDVFSDIIDSSYETIINPVERVIKMLDDNKQLLVDGLSIIEDINIQQRIQNNLALVRGDPEDFGKQLIYALNDSNNISLMLDIFDRDYSFIASGTKRDITRFLTREKLV